MIGWMLGDYSEAAKSLSAMTATDRTEWASTRNKYFTLGINKDSLHVLESAIFHVSFGFLFHLNLR